MGIPRSLKVGPLILLFLAGELIFAPGSAAAQEVGFGIGRKWLYAVAGAAIAAVPAYMFNTGGNSFGSGCTSDTCVTVAASMIGAGVGFLIGSEVDSRRNRRMAAGPSLDYSYRDYDLGLVPDRMATFRGGAAVVGLGGVRIVTRDGQLHSRAAAVRGIQDITIVPALDLMILSTSSNLLAFPVHHEQEQGQIIETRGGGSIEAFEEKLAVAGFDRLHLLRLRGAEDEFGTEELATLADPGFVTDLAYSDYSGVIWALLDDRLVALDSDLVRVGELQLPGGGRSVRARGGRVVVAAGTHGVFLIDGTDPTAPELVQEFAGVRFAYAADIDGDRLCVAAGSEGMAIVDLSSPELRVLGVAREVDVATDVMVSEDGVVWILDRDGRSVQIAEFGIAETASAADGGS